MLACGNWEGGTAPRTACGEDFIQPSMGKGKDPTRFFSEFERFQYA